ncbi:MAG TPA: hypothetical protein VE959_15590 [Bryobacteraceae bacterium]|nr:hypothetical protein [Bryobacteraceae bacterium]
MTLALPLEPREEARLLALAQAKARGILAKYGPAPSAEEIDRNRAEMFANFARDDS